MEGKCYYNKRDWDIIKGMRNFGRERAHGGALNEEKVGEITFSPNKIMNLK